MKTALSKKRKASHDRTPEVKLLDKSKKIVNISNFF